MAASPQPDSTPGTLPSPLTVPAAGASSEAFATDATLSVGLAGEPDNWNPVAAGASRGGTDPALATVADAVLPSASVAGADGALHLNVDVVSSVVETAAVPGSAVDRPAATPQTVIYEIDPRSTWSDGVAITAADFIYTWEAQSGQARWKDRGGRAFTPASTAGYRQISSVTSPAGDADRVVVRFATPDADWQALFDPILPAHIARSVGFDEGFTDPVTSLVSGGPFLVQSYQPGADVVLVRNLRWWGPAAHVATLDIVFVDSATVAAASLEQGQIDAAVTAFAPATVAALRATAGLTVSVTDGSSFDDLVFDERSGPLTVRAVRLALMVAIDRRSVSLAAGAEGDTAAAPIQNRAFPPARAAYDDNAGVLGPAAAAQASRRAAGLLAAAGYVRRGSTLVHVGRAVALTLAVETASPLASIEVEGIVGAIRGLGIAVHVTTPPSGRRVPSGGMAIVQTPLTATALAGTYATGSAANLSTYSSPVMDRLLDRLASAGSSAERNEMVDAVDALAWNDGVDLPLLGVPSVLTFQSRYAPLPAPPTATGVGEGPAQWGIQAT